MRIAVALAKATANIPDWVYGKETIQKLCRSIAFVLARAITHLPDWVYGKATIQRFCLVYTVVSAMLTLRT